MVVLTSKSNRYTEVAQKIADVREETVTTSIEDLPSGDVIYVTAPGDLDEHWMVALQERLVDLGSDDGSFSIITGYTAEQAMNLYTRGDAEDLGDRHAVLLRQLTNDYEEDTDATYLDRQEVAVDEIRSLQSDGMSTLALFTSGWSMHLRLDDGYICGFPETQAFDEYDGRQPYCVRDGERDCPFDGELIPAENLAASHVFVNSCASMIDNNLTRLPVHVGMGLLTQVSSMIGAFRLDLSFPEEVLLGYALMRAGYDLSERCYLLNRTAHSVGVKYLPYIPFGHPRAQVDNPTPWTFTWDIDSDGRDCSLTLRNVDTHVVDLTVPESDALLAEEWFLRYVDIDDSETPFYYVAFEEQEGIRILIFNGGRITADELRFELDTRPIAAAERSIAFAALENAHQQNARDLLTEKGQRQLLNLQKQVNNLSDYVIQERYNARIHEQIAEYLHQNITGDINGLQSELLSELDEWLPFFNTYFRSSVSTDAYTAAFSCHTCGRPLFIRETADVPRTGRRAAGFCSRCGCVFDVPTEAGQRRPNYPKATGNLVDGSETKKRFEVEFTNTSEIPVQGVCKPWVSQPHEVDDATELFEPGIVDISLDPGETFHTEFTVDTSDLPENMYYVSTTALLNLETYMGVAPMLVGDRSGRISERWVFE